MQTSQTGDTVDTLFGIDVQYQVPRYQRRYVWNEANWHTLWEDILYQFGLELVEAADGDVTFKQPGQSENTLDPDRDGEETHFTGPFVTKPITSGRLLSRFEVIDGQQRLATFQIILCIIRDICLSQDSDELTQLANEVEKLIVNQEPVIRRNTPGDFPDPTYKFRPTDYDRSAFDAVAEGEYGKVIPQAFDEAENRLKPDLVEKARSQVFCGSNVSINILDAYDYFYVQIRGYVGVNYDYDKIDDLISSIKSNFELVQITLDSSDQPEKIFESLNATGRMLSEFDYLRNNLFLRAGKREDNNGRSYSDIFYDKYWIFENDSQYWSADRLDVFFQTFLKATVGPYCFQSDKGSNKARKAFEVYQKQYYRKIKNKEVEYEFEVLRDYAESYKEMHDSTSLLSRRIQFYNDLHLIFDGLNPMNLYPLMLFIKNEVELSDCKLTQIFDILESYVLRCQLRQGVYEDKATYTKIDALLDDLIQGNISIKEPRIVAEYLSNSGKDGRDWLNNQTVVNGLRSAARQRHYVYSSYVQRLIRNMLGYILYRIERWSQENTSKTAKEVTFHIENFLRRDQVELPLYEQFLMPPSKLERHDFKSLYSLGNLTYCTKHLSRDLSFTEKKKILLEGPNADIMLNQKIYEKYSTWGPEQIVERERDLLDCFYQIWPPAEHFISKVPKPKVTSKTKSPASRTSNPKDEHFISKVPKPKVTSKTKSPASRTSNPKDEHFISKVPKPKVTSKTKSPTSRTSNPKDEPQWVSMVQPNEYQFVTFVSYTGIANLSRIQTDSNKVIGVNRNNNKQRLEKSNILFACPATAWPEVEPHIQIRTKVRIQNLQPIQDLKRLDIKHELLKSAQEEQFLVFPVTRYGHELEGSIEGFDTDSIHMQIREHTVIVYRRGLYEFATDERKQGVVTQFNKAQGHGLIGRYSVHINEVLDKNIRELEPDQKVEFNINQTTTGLVAINVGLVKD